MEPSKENFRFYILTRMKLGLKAKQIHGELADVYADKSPSFDTVARWIRHFSDGRESLEDEGRSGRPRTSLTTETVARADAIVRDDRSITLRFLAAELGVSYGSAQSIMHEELGRRKCCARWVPHLLTDHQRAERVRICRQWLEMFDSSSTKRLSSSTKRLSDVVTGDECWISFFTNKDKASNMVWLSDEDPRPEVLKTSFRSRKRMFTIFFNSQGIVSVDILPEKSTINAHYYTNTVLPKVLQNRAEAAPTRSGSRVLLHHDNASAHTAARTVTFLNDQHVQLLEHPPYSPDLAPCDFWLFPKLKKGLAGRPFSRIQDLARSVHSELRSIPPSEYRECFQSWLHRMQRCIEVQGAYFEGM